MDKITIVIVDDHKLIRDTWRMLLNRDLSYKVVASCGNAEDAIEQARKFQPNIILLDINLPGMSGVDALPSLIRCSPLSRIIGVSISNQPIYARRMFTNGASAYITKNSSFSELKEALKEVYEGKKYICNEIKDILSKQSVEEERKDIVNLSTRELEIVSLIKKGCSSKEIGESLLITTKTVEAHRYNILKKTKLKNMTSVVNFLQNSQVFI